MSEAVATFAPPPRPLPRPGRLRPIRLLRTAVGYELRKQSAFRTGFLVREVLRGVERPAVMSFVYLAMFRASDATTIRGFTFPDLVRYLLLVATFQKLLFHERALDLAEQIFDGYVTKFVVMPLHYFVLVLARFVQFTIVQVAVAATFWTAGALLLPDIWPLPAGPAAALQALTLVLLGSYCFLLVFFMVNTLAFWLGVVWTVLGMTRMAAAFVMGDVIPVSMMPRALRTSFRWLFPYWSLSAPIEIFLGRPQAPSFAEGVVVLSASALALQIAALVLWRRGLRRYAGSGM